MVRRFTISNSVGRSYNLNTSDIKFFNPEGLGLKEDFDYLKVGNNYIPVNEQECQQVQIKGTLFFTGRKPYETYNSFVKFVRQPPLVLSYTTFDSFSITVDAAELGKTELTKGGILTVPVVFLARGLWFKTLSGYIPASTGVRPVYPYTYPDVYPEEISQGVILTSDSNHPSPCKITIWGEVTNPEWRHYVNGVFIGNGKYTGTISEGHMLVIDTTSIPYSIIEYDSSGVMIADRYALCDFSTKRFFLLKRGKNQITISHGGLSNVAVKVEARIEYESV